MTRVVTIPALGMVLGLMMLLLLLLLLLLLQPGRIRLGILVLMRKDVLGLRLEHGGRARDGFVDS